MSTRWLWRRLSGITDVANKKSYFLSYLTGWWSRNEKSILRTARTEFGSEFNTVWEVLEYVMNSPNRHGVSWDNIWRCCQEKNLARLAIEYDWSSNVRRYNRIWKRKQTRAFTVNKANADLIISALDELENCWDAQKPLRSLLCSVRTADELRFCHELIYWVWNTKVIPEEMVKSLGKIKRSYLKWLSSTSGSTDIYKHIALEKFSGWKADKKAILELIIDEQIYINRAGNVSAGSLVKEYEWVKHTIRNLNDDEFKVIKNIFHDTNANKFDTTLLRELFKTNTIDNIIREISKLGDNQKTRAKIWKIIEDNVNTQALKNWARKISSLTDANAPKFIKVLWKIKKVARVVSKI